MKVTLYKKDVTGSIRFWEGHGFIEDGQGIIEIQYGQLGGAIQTQTEYIGEGKAARTLKEQVMSRLASRIGKRRDLGYVNSLEEAKNTKATNQLNLMRPMLAQKFKGVLPNEFYLQLKYDGNRCLVYNSGHGLIAYTRAGKRNENLEHILKDIDIPVGYTLDGELYCHGVPLQTIRSWVSRKQPDTERLQYMLYDIMIDSPYSKRLETIKSFNLGPSITLAETRRIEGNTLELEGGISALLTSARESGYEGLIARVGDLPYEDGKRSKSLIKIKAWHDDEFVVTDIISSADNWAILVCMSDNGVFKVTAPGDIPFKERVLRYKENYLGRKVTVEYANLTSAGLPFHPVAIAFRDSE
jgi:ATP-dependent DNA ligase